MPNTLMSLELGSFISSVAAHLRKTLTVSAMEKERKEKRKKTVKRDSEDPEKKPEAVDGVICTDNNQKRDEESVHISREKTTPEGFYIAHPKNVKRTAHFKDVHSRKLAELLEAFHMFDFDRDGIINHEDLKKTFASLCIEIDGEEIEQMLSEGLNPLNFDAFVILLGYKTLDLDPEEVVLDALSNWDDHEEGLISHERLKLHLMAWGDKFTEEEATAALADAPVILNKAKEKMIDYVQFSEDLCGLRKMMQRKSNQEEH